MWSFDGFFIIVTLKNLLDKPSNHCSFEMAWCPCKMSLQCIVQNLCCSGCELTTGHVWTDEEWPPGSKEHWKETQRSGGLFIHIVYIEGLVQDCGNSSALAMELLQFCTKSSICNVTAGYSGEFMLFWMWADYRSCLGWWGMTVRFKGTLEGNPEIRRAFYFT